MKKNDKLPQVTEGLGSFVTLLAAPSSLIGISLVLTWVMIRPHQSFLRKLLFFLRRRPHGRSPWFRPPAPHVHHFAISSETPMIDAHWKQIILSLLHLSQDHVAETLRQSWGDLPLLPVDHKPRSSGAQIHGWIHETLFELQAHQDSKGDVKIEFFQNGQSMFDFKLVRNQTKFKSCS